MTTADWLTIIFSVLIGTPLSVLLIFAAKRVVALRKLSKPIGTLFITQDGVYSEFETELDEISSKRQIVLRVKNITKKGGE